jgi:hypothetical protein
MRPLEEWDEDYINNEIRPADESDWLEKKASAKFSLKGGRPDEDTKQELAKQVSAFSNAGQGYLVYGIDNNKNLDTGVPELIGRQPVSEWIEGAIPGLVYPPVTQCVARLIRLPAHAPDRGVLVVSIPLSESRPHWVTSPREAAYIRAGSHSSPMRLQTMLDLASRGTTSQGEIETLDSVRRPGVNEKVKMLGSVGRPYGVNANVKLFDILPRVRLVAGPVCDQWAFEITDVCGEGVFHVGSAHGPMYRQVGGGGRTVGVCFVGGMPLFPHRSTPVTKERFSFSCRVGTEQVRLMAVLYAGSARPVRREFTLGDLESATQRP